MNAFSDRVLVENATVLQQMLNHRFVADVKADRMAGDVFRRYLVYEGAFVETAISIFAFATAKAPGIGERRWLIGVLDALANQQCAYFEKVFEALSIDAGSYDLQAPGAARFIGGMHAIARDGGYLDIVAAMFAAEWMYWTWCRDAAASPSADRHIRRWVDMHADDAFAGQARWLKNELDRHGATLDEPERKRLSTTFGRVMRLEIDFHDAAYDGAAAR